MNRRKPGRGLGMDQLAQSDRRIARTALAVGFGAAALLVLTIALNLLGVHHSLLSLFNFLLTPTAVIGLGLGAGWWVLASFQRKPSP